MKPMTLTGPTGSFELTVLDYEYSDSPSFLERNGLLVCIRGRHQDHEWAQVAPVLSTWELELLRDWIHSLIDHKAPSHRLTFVEPDLSFNDYSPQRDEYDLRLKLCHHVQPDWQNSADQPFYMPLSPDTEQLQNAVAHLDEQLRQFPVRD